MLPVENVVGIAVWNGFIVAVSDVRGNVGFGMVYDGVLYPLSLYASLAIWQARSAAAIPPPII